MRNVKGVQNTLLILEYILTFLLFWEYILTFLTFIVNHTIFTQKRIFDKIIFQRKSEDCARQSV